MDAPQTSDLPRDSRVALTSIRTWKTFFLAVVLLCLAVHVGAWVVATRTDLLDAKRAAAVDEVSIGRDSPLARLQGGTGMDSRTGAIQPAATAEVRGRADRAYAAIQAALPLTEFLGRAGALLLCLTFVFATLVALVGHLPASGFVGAFFRGLAALALLLPWDRLTPQGARVPGVFVDPAALLTTMDSSAAPALGPVLPIARFVAYPVLAACILLLANSCFRRSFRELETRASASIPMRVV